MCSNKQEFRVPKLKISVSICKDQSKGSDILLLYDERVFVCLFFVKRNKNIYKTTVMIAITSLLVILLVIVLFILPNTNKVFAFAGWGPKYMTTASSTAISLSSSIVDGNKVTTTTDNQDHSNNVNGNNINNNIKTVDILSLESIRSTLIRQEETIIFALIERSQFRQNAIVYQKGGFGNLGTPPGSKSSSEHEDEVELSFLEYMLIGTETLHCWYVYIILNILEFLFVCSKKKVTHFFFFVCVSFFVNLIKICYSARRYESPEEHAFFPNRLPIERRLENNLPNLQYPDGLLSSKGAACDVNYNDRLLNKYIHNIVPKVCKVGDDEQHGSTSLCDIAVLQALSRRIHYGKFVAESKYRSNPEEYQRLVAANDVDGVMELLTNKAVEKKVLHRAKLKAATYGTEPLLLSSDLPNIIEGNDNENNHLTTLIAAAASSAVVAALSVLNTTATTTNNNKVDPSVIEDIYKTIIIPMTKDIEVTYLFRRCGAGYDPPSSEQ